MQAIVFRQYGSPDVLRLEEVATPAPKDNEVLVRVHSASVNAGDWHILRAEPFLVRLAFGLFTPKINILGADMAGIVESAGPNATRFKPGDAVFGDISACGFGAFAEYVCVPEKYLASKPESCSFEEAAATPAAALTALQGLRKGGIKGGQKVLINGASGGVGTFAVQIAKSFGAEVTGVCSTRNLDRVRALGADHVIDYTKEDFTKGGQRYDFILAANGCHPISAYQRALNPAGSYVMTGGATKQFFQAALLGPVLSMASGKKMGSVLMQPNPEDMATVAELLASGKIAPTIDRQYPLRQVPDAIRYIEEEHARGKVVITVVPEG